MVDDGRRREVGWQVINLNFLVTKLGGEPKAGLYIVPVHVPNGTYGTSGTNGTKRHGRNEPWHQDAADTLFSWTIFIIKPVTFFFSIFFRMVFIGGRKCEYNIYQTRNTGKNCGELRPCLPMCFVLRIK